MSKSKKNVINPDDILTQYGADAFRMYEMFMGPFEASKPWDMKGIEGINRFLKRVYAWGSAVKADDSFTTQKDIEVLKNKTIIKVSSDIENFSFNTAVSALMIFFNDLGKLREISAENFRVFMQLLHPFAPHITEELWAAKSCKGFIIKTGWPAADKGLLAAEDLSLGVQVNGKVRGSIIVPADAGEQKIKDTAMEEPNVKRYLEGKVVVKVIIVPKKMVNIVVK
jgi:leucyl-tRNA synthetase